MRPAMIVGLAFLIVSACAARTDLGGHVIDDAAVDARRDGSTAAPDADGTRSCSLCGGESSGESCTDFIYCNDEVSPDASEIVCNDARHEISCSCATSTCTCVSGGVTGETVSFASSQCLCQAPAFGDESLIQPIIDACAF